MSELDFAFEITTYANIMLFCVYEKTREKKIVQIPVVDQIYEYILYINMDVNDFENNIMSLSFS